MGILLISAVIFSSLSCKINVDITLPDKARVVVISKKQGLLRVVEKRGTDYVTANEYFVSYGQSDGTKSKDGDKKTPEGVYFIEKMIPREELPDDIYGIMAAPLNYPNPIDRTMKKTGSGIWLHGTSNIENLSGKNATAGCIILKNTDIVELTKIMRPMVTPVVIAERFNDVKFNSSEVKTPVLNVSLGDIKYRVTAGLEKSSNVLYERL
ncbi:MAG: L,D-transpeptidase family protein [Pseudomonadota bacterium]